MKIVVCRDGPEGRRGDSRASGDRVGKGFVHAQGRALDIAAHVGDAGQLQQTLHRAVLAQLPMQDGKHDVQADRLVSPLLEDEQPAYVSVRREHSRPATAVLPICARAVAKLPCTALRNPDIERFVLLDIEVLCHLLRRFDGDRMLLATPAEYDSDLQPIYCSRSSGS